MENTIEIQKEFEILVSELERLKSINELTSSNANSAKTVVDEIDKIANAAKQIHSSVELDFLQKNEKINELLLQLSETITSTKASVRTTQSELQKKVDELVSASNDLVANNKVILNKEFESIKTSLDSNTVVVNSKLEELFSNASLTQSKELDNYIQEINELHKKSTATFLNSSNRFTNLIEKISTAIEENISSTQVGLQKIDEQLSNHISDYKKVIDDRFNVISTNFNDNFEELNRQLKQNETISKRNGLILLVSAITTIGLLITLLLK